MKIEAGKVFQRLEAIHRFLALVTGLAVLLLLSFMLYEVLMRYMIGKPAQWVVDASEMLMWPITFLAAAYIAQMDGHIRITLIVERLRQKVRRVLNIITSLLALGFSVLLLWQGLVASLTARKSHTITSTAYLPMWHISLVIGIGAFFLCLQFIISIARDIAWLRSPGKEEAPETPSVSGRTEA